jgi:hypothetical protein
VRWVIILIVVVFDPLALCLILASNKQLEWAREDKKSLVHIEEEQPDLPLATDTGDGHLTPPYEPDDAPLTEEQLEQIRAIAANAAVDRLEKPEPIAEVIESDIEQFFANAQIAAQKIDANEYHTEDLKIPILENEEMWTQRVIDEHKEDEYKEEKVVEPVIDKVPPEPVKPVDEFNTPIRRGADYAVRYQGKVYNLDAFTKLHPELSVQADNEPTGKAAQCGFGDKFPDTPEKGDMFIRTDYLPERLYKWNNTKWIEVDKNSTDSYTYNQAYIQHLIQKLEAGEYEIEDLNDAEQSQVEQQIEDILKNKNV